MFARWPGDALQPLRIAGAAPRYDVPQAMFSPMVPRRQPAARNVDVNGEPHGVCENSWQAPIRWSFRRAARSSVRLARSAGRPALRRVWLISWRIVAISPAALEAVTGAGGGVLGARGG